MKRSFVTKLIERLKEPPRAIQMVLGPRQVGKTTGVLQLREELPQEFIYRSADEVFGRGQDWLQSAWNEARLARTEQSSVVLVIDEIQKIPSWSQVVKGLWDKDVIDQKTFHVILLGSSALELHTGLSESLVGRFERIFVPHWNFLESRELVPGLQLDQFLQYGGYPAPLLYTDDARRRSFLTQSILEPIITQDILQNATVKKPALFRQAFEVACLHGGEVLSLNKFLGQLQEGGNVDLVKHYLELYQQAYLVSTLEKFSTNRIQKKSSSPKLLPAAPAFLSLFDDFNRGRSFEVMIGNDLVQAYDHVTYWREGNLEVDFVVKIGKRIIGIEVKSGRRRDTRGLSEFCERFKASGIVITDQNFQELHKMISVA